MATHNLVAFRRGSGVYVNPSFFTSLESSKEEAEPLLAPLLNQAVALAQKLGLAENQMYALLDSTLAASRRLVLVEPEDELAQIVCFEIKAAGRQVPEVCTLAPDSFAEKLHLQTSGKTPVAFASKASAAREALGDSAALIVLQV